MSPYQQSSLVSRLPKDEQKNIADETNEDHAAFIKSNIKKYNDTVTADQAFE